MNKTNNTKDILDAIRDMMGEKNSELQSELPKDVFELTKSINDDEKIKDIDVLELKNPINHKNHNDIEDSVDAKISNIPLDNQKIRELVREQVQLIPSEKIDQIIREELERVISEKLTSAEISFNQNGKT